MNYLLLNYLKIFTWTICLLIVLGCSAPHNEKSNDLNEVVPVLEPENVVDDAVPAPELENILEKTTPAAEPESVIAEVPSAPGPVSVVEDVAPTVAPENVIADVVPAPESEIVEEEFAAVPESESVEEELIPVLVPEGVIAGVPAVPESESVEEESAAAPESEIVEEESVAAPESESVEEEFTAAPESEGVEEESVAVPESESVEEESAAVPESESVEEESAAVPESESVEEESAAVPESESVEEESAAVPESESVEEESAAVPESESVEEESVAAPESEGVEEESVAAPESESFVEEELIPVLVPEGVIAGVPSAPESESFEEELIPVLVPEGVIAGVPSAPESESFEEELIPVLVPEGVIAGVPSAPESESFVEEELIPVLVPEGVIAGVPSAPESESFVEEELIPVLVPENIIAGVPSAPELESFVEEGISQSVQEVITIPPIKILTDPVNSEDSLGVSRWRGWLDRGVHLFRQARDRVLPEKITFNLEWISNKITETGQSVSELGRNLYQVWNNHLEERRQKDEQDSRVSNIISGGMDTVVGFYENQIVSRVSVVSGHVSSLNEKVVSGWEEYLEERKQEEINEIDSSIESLASKVKSYTEIETPEMSDHIRADVRGWVNLSIIDRNELRYQRQGIMDKYGLSLIPVDLKETVTSIEHQDTTQTISNWSSLTYEQRRGLQYRGQDIRSYYEISNLSQTLQDIIAEIEASDEQRKIEIENQWARLRTGSETRNIEIFLSPTDNPEMEEYQLLGVKLFPIHVGDSNYPRTRRNNMRQLSLKGQDMRLEIHSDTNLINYEVLAEFVQEIQLIIECPDQLHCKDNVIRFNSGGYWEEYSLDQLMDHQNTDRYIKINPSQLDGITEVSWRSTTRSYRGSFRIQFAHQTRNSESFEWSLINDLHIEEYIRSVVPSEFPVASDIDALKAQTIAARSFALYHVVMARTIRSRKWDVKPTTQFQLYSGIEEEDPRSDRAIEETRGIVLSYRSRVAFTEYFSCAELATNDDPTNPVANSKNIPSYFLCADYDHISLYRGHGRGLPQIVIMELAREGWRGHADNLPTENAVVPENFDRPWNYRDILFYFYDNVYLSHYTNIRLD